jgi:hypothetical protein
MNEPKDATIASTEFDPDKVKRGPAVYVLSPGNLEVVAASDFDALLALYRAVPEPLSKLQTFPIGNSTGYLAVDANAEFRRQEEDIERLLGVKFSDRNYFALRDRAEKAEAELSSVLTAEVGEFSSLRAAAEKITLGRWTSSRSLNMVAKTEAVVWGSDGDAVALVYTNLGLDDDAGDVAEFIAAASPETILKLLSQLSSVLARESATTKEKP